MIRFLEKYVMPVAGKVAEQRHLQAIRDGIILKGCRAEAFTSNSRWNYFNDAFLNYWIVFPHY